jgi:hypothetical protein
MIASNLHFSWQAPHLMQAAWSMTWTSFGVPLMQ